MMRDWRTLQCWNNPLNTPEAAVAAEAFNAEALLRRGIFRVEKFRDGEEAPYEVQEFENTYVNTGGAAFLDRLIGTGATAFDNTNAYLGVGDSSTSTTSGMTDLQAATNKVRVAMDATFPSRSGQVMTWKSTFGSGVGNFAWQEFALFNASSGGTMLSRGTQSLGTKASGTTWVLTYTITIP